MVFVRLNTVWKMEISTLGEYSFKRTYLGLKASLSKGVSG